MAIAPVTTMLPQPGFFAPRGKRIVIAAGGGRDTTTGKRIVVATFEPGWDRFGLRDLSRDATRAWVSPACSSDGTLAAAAAGPDGHGGAHLRPRRSIWLLSLDGRTRRRLTRPPAGSSDEAPQWTANGAAVVFVRQTGTRGMAYLVGLDGRPAGPIAHVDGAVAGNGFTTWAVALGPTR